MIIAALRCVAIIMTVCESWYAPSAVLVKRFVAGTQLALTFNTAFKLTVIGVRGCVGAKGTVELV